MVESSSISEDMVKNLFEEAKASLIHLTTLSNTILDNITEAIIITDTHCKIVSCNKAVHKQFGIVAEDLLRQDLFTVIKFPEEPTLRETAAQVLATQHSCAIHHSYEHPQIGSKYLGTTIYPLTEAKKITGLIWVTSDFTERNQTEKALQESEELYRLLVENVSDLIFMLDLDLNWIYLSPSITRLLGYSVEEVMTSLTVKDLMTSESFETIQKVYAEEMAIENMPEKDIFRSTTLELEQVHKSGTTVWTEIKVHFLRDSDNQAIGILGVTRDISERKQVETLRSTLARTKEYLELRKLLDEKLEAEIGLMVTYAGTVGPTTIFNHSRLTEQDAFNLTYRGFTVLMSSINYQDQTQMTYGGTIEIPNSDFFALGFYREMEGYPAEVQQDPRLKSTAIMFLLVMRKQIMAFMLQMFLQIEEFFAFETRNWSRLSDVSESELESLHKKLREFILKTMEDQQEDLIAELAEQLLDTDDITKVPELIFPR